MTTRAVAELARHWVAATRPTDLDKALRYTRRAGDLARDTLAPDDAMHWYQTKPSTSSGDRPPPTNTNAPNSSPRSAPSNAKPEIPTTAHTLVRAATLAQDLDDTDVVVPGGARLQPIRHQRR